MHRAVVLLSLISTSAALKPEWLPQDYPMTEQGAESFVSDYNSTAEEVFYFSTEASWNYNTNLTEHNSQLQVKVNVFYRHLAHSLTKLDAMSFTTDFHVVLLVQF